MKRVISSLVVMIACAALPAAADTRVERVDADTLRLTDFSGKPPFKRQLVSASKQPELYAFWEDQAGLTPQPVYAVESRGAPGKSLPSSRLRISSDPAEVAEFARFEEAGSEEAGQHARRWSGAPGKGRRAR